MTLVQRIFSLYPAEAALVRDADLNESLVRLADNGRGLRGRQPKRALRCRIPKPLKALLKEVSSEKGKPMVALLLECARRYRDRYPIENDWQAPTAAELIENEDRGLKAEVYFLSEGDRELIQNLGRGVTGVRRRREAFERLIPILKGLRDELPSRGKRVSVRASIPQELHELILEQTREGQSYVEILLDACRESQPRD
jgi:hypothetical protein